MDDLNIRIREEKLEKIRLFLSERFKQDFTREEALNLIVESFYNRFYDEI